jgi:hypothetical protein
MKPNYKKFSMRNVSLGVAAAVLLILAVPLAVNYSNGASKSNAQLATSEANPVNTTVAQAPEVPLTGRLTVYILPLSFGPHDPHSVIAEINNLVGDAQAAYHHPNLGASLQGQYADERVTLTEDIPEESAKKGDTMTTRVIKKPADTVKFYIDPEVKKPDGSPVTIADIREDYSFGNGITCCGFELKDETDVTAVFFVVDQGYDPFVMQKIQTLKSALSRQ